MVTFIELEALAARMTDWSNPVSSEKAARDLRSVLVSYVNCVAALEVIAENTTCNPSKAAAVQALASHGITKAVAGTTSQQIVGAPRHALYVCHTYEHADYVARLAAHLGRSDLWVVPASGALQRARGCRLTGLVVDHACDMKALPWETREALRGRVNP